MMPAQGWTPAIPVGSKNMTKYSVQDIILRAKSGLPSGDIQKEAHTAYYLGKLNEDQENFKVALSFYKRLYFCSRILEDPFGASLALNRLGIVYFKSKKIIKSIKFHMKHCKITDNDNAFIAYYNIAICHRILADYSKAYWYFSKALEWSQFREVSIQPS